MRSRGLEHWIYPSTAFNQATDSVSGMCSPWYDVMRNSRKSGLQHFTFMLVPKSIEELAEVRDLSSLYAVPFHSPGGVQVVFLLKSAARPETIPTSFATIKLIQDTNHGFINELWKITFHAKSIRENFHQIRQLYEISDIQNKVPDGKISFPEDSRSLASGVTVEFRCVTCSSNPPAPRVTETLWKFCASRNVSFRYPNKEDFALRNASFKIEKGQLCVSRMVSTSKFFSTSLTFNSRLSSGPTVRGRAPCSS